MKRILPILFIVAGTLLVISLVSWRPVPAVNAQCGTTSSCQTCHETLGEHPVNQTGAWHIDHNEYDICADCHGGNNADLDQAIAHEGTSLDLADMATSCFNCHTDNYADYFQRYADQLGVQSLPSISQPSYLDNLSSALCITPVGVDPNAINKTNLLGTGNLVLIIIISLGVLAGAALIWMNERRLKKKYKGEKHK